MLVSVVIRTLNEARYLGELLQAIKQQDLDGRYTVENVLVDSGSTDETLAIAKRHDCVIKHIRREEFSFGRALNIGCETAAGEILIIISGHCVPVDSRWLKSLCDPIADGRVVYSYGRQIGGPESHFSECRIFDKYYPETSAIPQEGFFCNNANSAILKSAWARHAFDEELTGLEDMWLARRLHYEGGRIGYVAEACVYHYHSETWAQIKRRFEREAIALQRIMPQVHVSMLDAVRYIFRSVNLDWRHARQQGRFSELAWDILHYRYCQYAGSYKGNHEHRQLSHVEKEKYFYPENSSSSIVKERISNEQATHRRTAAHESQQRARQGQELSAVQR